MKLTVSIIIPAAVVFCLAVQKVQGAANVPAVSLPHPRPVCGPVCAIFCECGNIPDERGCPTCRCRPCGPPICPLRRCARPVKCLYGLKKVNGCPTCECNPGPVLCSKSACPPTLAIKCQYGVKIVDGCPTCSCNPRPVCPRRQCLRECKNGYKKINGCPSCQCNPGPVLCSKSACPPTLAIKCQYGVKIVDGCPTCSCNPRPPTCPKLRCSRPLRCPNGVKEVNGCPTCSCKPRLCPRVSSNQCRRRCLFGYATQRRRGCRTCVCRRRSRFADIE
ncbi:antistasin-like isoform X5 [Haliotis rufescens]|uniref:antistasin-like isoform X5 n=1 Tax=Haliotis rufescens TaxID=6454 RepID=UPI001EAFDA0C|nr:antistasin-like isoform X5 [Haliotis rufescens]